MERVNDYSFLAGGGEMGSLIRSFDWTHSPVGTPTTWPQSLRTTVSMILSSKFPMILWWGSELIQFYNDAYRPSLGNQGKHPKALGQPASECWPEVWPTIKPLIDQVLNGDEPIWSENQCVPIYRNGHMEEVYWTYSYSPVLTESDQIGGVLVVCQETTKMVLGLQQLQQSEARFRTIVEMVPMAIGLLRGREMVIEVGNAILFKIWGKDPSIIGMPLVNALPEVKGHGKLAQLETVYDTGEPSFSVDQVVTLEQDGQFTNHYFDSSYSPLRDLAGSITGILILSTDVTAHVLARQVAERDLVRLKIAEQEVNRVIQHEREINAQKEQFLTFVSHQFRNPMTGISLAAEALAIFGDRSIDPILSQKVIQYTQQTRQEIKRLDQLLTKVLNRSGAKSKQSPLQPEAVDLVSFCRNLITHQLKQNKDYQRVKLIMDQQEVWVKADRVILEQVVENLTSNALKYSVDSKKPVEVSLETRADEIRIRVKDYGIGIPAQELEHIGKSFFRASNTGFISGIGLGLSLSHQFIKQHGGQLLVESKLNQYTIFTILLPS